MGFIRASSLALQLDSQGPRCKLSPTVPDPIRCLYCDLDFQKDKIAAHLDECRVRAAVHVDEAKLSRLLTDEEIEAIRERF